MTAPGTPVCVAVKVKTGLPCEGDIIVDEPLPLCRAHYKWARDLWFYDFEMAIGLGARRKTTHLHLPRFDGWISDTRRLEYLWHMILRLFVVLGIEQPHEVPESLREEVRNELLQEYAEQAARQLGVLPIVQPKGSTV